MIGDLADLCGASATGGLGQRQVTWLSRPAVCVVLAAAGYPDVPRTGQLIDGLDRAREHAGVAIFHAGTALDESYSLVVAGGRVLDVVALGTDLADARRRAYEAIEDIDFEGMRFRDDIAQAAARLAS
jgi:phosphoribosylamine--glycine ligase